MANMFSDLEGVRIAMAMEARGRDFYQQAYQLTPNPTHKELFLWLKNEEIHHLTRFTALFEMLENRKEAHSAEYLFDTDTSRYLTVIAEEHVFPKPNDAGEQFAGLTSVQAILQAALQAEKDSVLFYDELAAKAKFPEARDVFRLLKGEEQAHVVKIREMVDAWA
ncbi:ferritin family protein [Anaeroselena agilis]|uniref:Ferritin family protein n=1 Tax=Anaeroselena agilis TaxID=3063788 RepID=A0ABU3NXA2_9FIRM|nr:ferritin family protein [Selenomonadales bacterium 4137-cl]